MRRLLLSIAMLLATLIAAPADRPALAQSGQTFERSTLTIETANGNSYPFDVELALTPAQQTQGLMHRESMAPNAGMLFVFDRVRPLAFWMKNTLIPLDMLFLDAEGRIINIAERTTPLSLDSVPSAAPGKAVLELNGGITELLGIRPGDRVVHPLLQPEGAAPAEP